jgi:L-alanine-DL-glutamate epimerase-like enolase superfamily enzyme
VSEACAQDASPWQKDGHSAVRLLAGSRSGAVLLGGIAFQLQPGWKTYWRTPGDSGVPPRFDFSKSDNVEAVTVLWPAPLKFDDGAGGVSLGYQEPSALVDEVRPHLDAGYKAVKLRVGDSPARDLARIAAVRKTVGDEIDILVDANTAYTVKDARAVMPGMDDYRVGWLEEPFPPHDYRSYELATSFGQVPLASGENHFTRFEFSRVIEDGAITILQPDLSKTGGITELLRIAAMASAYKLPINPHTCMTGLNMAATIHVLGAIDNGGYFEGDVSKNNLFRDALTSTPYTVDRDGNVHPLEAPGIGVAVDEDFLVKHPPIEGPGYV